MPSTLSKEGHWPVLLHGNTCCPLKTVTTIASLQLLALQTAADKPLHVALTQPKLNYMLKSRNFLSCVANTAAQPHHGARHWTAGMLAYPGPSVYMLISAAGMLM